VFVPEKIVTGKTRTIVGVFASIRDHYYLAMRLVTPSPFHARWEPYLIIDRARVLRGREGYARISGYMSLVKYKCFRRVMYDLVGKKIIKRYHLAPWGLPALYTIDASDVLPIEKAAIVENNGVALLNYIRKINVRVVEI